MRGSKTIPLLFLSCVNTQPRSYCDNVSGDCVCAEGFDGFVCGDYVDDDCDGNDEPCPTIAPTNLAVPSWDCRSSPIPDNVYAWALFDSAAPYYQDGGCFVFFEGLKDEFYVQRKLTRLSTDEKCESKNGCICPSEDGWPSYDRRLYAFTLKGDPSDCGPIILVDHAGEDQPVSNACRKYLYQLHFYDIDVSFVAPSQSLLDARLAIFDQVEIACAQDNPHRSLPFKSLLVAPIKKNDAFQKKLP